MMRSVLNEGTAATARANGFTLDAGRQNGHDQRPARRVVRRLHARAADGGVVGFDDNQPVGLSGAKAALPIWTQFMKNALAGRRQRAVRGARRHTPSSRSTPKPASSRGGSARK